MRVSITVARTQPPPGDCSLAWGDPEATGARRRCMPTPRWVGRTRRLLAAPRLERSGWFGSSGDRFHRSGRRADDRVGDISIAVRSLAELAYPDLEQPQGMHKQTGDPARRRLRPGFGDRRLAHPGRPLVSGHA
jgi:hypothetical protein